ncbi:MAG: aminopeptidase P family protein [Phycisphaerales bacterium]|nr:aminopeptidase P family protein [Phycisphaerales bacterium]
MPKKPDKKTVRKDKRKDNRPDRPAPANHHAERLIRLRPLILAAGVDHLLITNPIDVGYLTGFLGGDSWMLIGADDSRPVVISDFRYQEELEPVRPLAEIFIRTKGMIEATGEILRGRRGTRCGIQAEHCPVADMVALSAMLGPEHIAPVGGVVARLRIKKDAHEIALIRRANRLQEDALNAVLRKVKPGRTELEIAARIEEEMKVRGSSEPGFKTIVAARANGSLPHYRPGNAKLAKGRTVLIDWGAVYQGYHGDMTRTFALGKWPGTMKEIYKIVLEAQETAAAALAPGRLAHEIDAIARNIIKAAGYGEQFGHGLGHGMGMNGHEDPRLNPLYPDMALEAGHVVTVEPGIYLPGIGGVRIEDNYVITDKGADNLCSMPKDLKWATL